MNLDPDDPVYVLLVDDLEENLLSSDALLRQEGLIILKARSGKEALELLLTHEVALALMDVQMPGMDGFELAELMRGSERTRRIPIIFLTAGSDDWQKRSAAMKPEPSTSCKNLSRVISCAAKCGFSSTFIVSASLFRSSVMNSANMPTR